MIRAIPISKSVPFHFRVINTTSRGGDAFWQQLSPFFLGPVALYGGRSALNVENGWQHAKVYRHHADENGEPTAAYWDWATSGWADPTAHRYPGGKRAKPLYSLWDGKRLDYISARKHIYVPLYAETVQRTEAYAELVRLRDKGQEIWLKDFDAYDHVVAGMSLTEVLNNPDRKMGHAFVLCMLLQSDPALRQCGRLSAVGGILPVSVL